ncbi:hypothetical protein ACIP97_24290 [Peribacillus frigoritolerans]|uniref:hypothetical protein n=1 Tax=Peribacillus frigoritolerans TaxID=450367 RepID=UPI0038293C7B
MKDITLVHGFGTNNETESSNAMLNPVRSNYQVLGTLAKFPKLLLNPKMNLSEDDFLQDFHKIVFMAIKNIICKDNSIKEITHVDIDDHLSQFAELYKVWNVNDGISYMKKSIEHANSNAFKLHYREIKKYTLVRQFVGAGIDVSGVLKYYETDLKLYTESRKQFELLRLEEIEKQLIEIGKGNAELQDQLSYRQEEIDSQIAMLQKQKQELKDFRKKLA